MNVLAYLGLPYDIRGEAGVNCWGLYRLVMLEEQGIDLVVFKPESFSIHGIADKFSSEIIKADHNHDKVSEPNDFDLVVMTREIGRKIYHCGVYVGGNVLHAKGSGRNGQVWLEPLCDLNKWDLEFWRYAK